ncbi:MAG: hypothetical protein OK441_03620 [Thaumarchaeota archaeon]|nr:hypothetical protein [Nitrososphaerota archaeon]
MSKTRVRSGRFTRYATLLMIALGVASILVNTTLAAVIIALGVAMFLFERLFVGGGDRRARPSE